MRVYAASVKNQRLKSLALHKQPHTLSLTLDPMPHRWHPIAALAAAARQRTDMNIIESIIDFFIRLFRQRVDSVQFQAKAKLMSAQTRAKSKAANSFNKAIDKPIKKAASKVRRKK